jgi:branched-chain amino acid transport system ATP-binding protein
MTARTTIPAAAVVAGIGYVIFTGDNYQLYVIALVGLTAIAGVGLNVLLGLSGQISLGHAGFYAIGAYAVGLLTASLDVPFFIALAAAAAAAGAAGMLLAIPALRVRGPTLAMVTIAFGFVVEQATAEWSGLTGGWNGLMGIPPPRAFGFEFAERAIALMVLAFTGLSLILYAQLRSSPWGMAMRAVRDAEVASQSIGLDPMAVRATAFAISAAATGFAGGVFAAMTNFISPESFPFFQSILFLLVVMVGGADTVLGPLVGAVVVVLLPEALSFLAQYRLLFVGLLLLVVLRLTPMGIVGMASRFLAPAKPQRAPSSNLDVAAYLSTQSAGNMLVVSDLSVSFGGVRAVSNLSFQARAGEVTSIIGPNGAGKSTVLNLICGFYAPHAGRVRLGEVDITQFSSHAVARMGIARTYQTTQLFANMSVLDNVRMALRRGRLGALEIFSPDRDPEHRAIAQSLLAFVGYRGELDQWAGALPHVDKRLVELARALALRPRVLALDEPAAGLDRGDSARIGDLLRQVAAAGIAVILVEHDMDLVMRASDRVLVLDAGSKIAEGRPEEVSADPRVRRAYLGDEQTAERTRRRELAPARRPLVAANKLCSGYGAGTIIRDIDLHVDAGELVAVLGANGAGKSTLMRALSGLNRPIAGEVLFLNERIEGFPAHRIARAGLVLVPEGRQVFPELSVTDNLRLGGYVQPLPEIASRIERLLDRFPQLRARQHQRAGLLSGGEQQLLAIARGLMAQPRVLMLDEPSLGLAPMLLTKLYELLAELREEGTTMLLVDQMAGLALSVADRTYVLRSGAIAHSGSAAQVRADPALVRAYLGEHEATMR